jgi:hypothetical protein
MKRCMLLAAVIVFIATPISLNAKDMNSKNTFQIMGGWSTAEYLPDNIFKQPVALENQDGYLIIHDVYVKADYGARCQWRIDTKGGTFFSSPQIADYDEWRLQIPIGLRLELPTGPPFVNVVLINYDGPDWKCLGWVIGENHTGVEFSK